MRSDVSFPSAGIGLAGHLYTPADTGPRPGIVIGHPASGVKEQAAAAYAERLVTAGFVVLTFDAAHQGASGGEPRGLEDPAQRTEDLKAAVSFLTTRPEVDADRIGALGICASGGYVLPAAAGDHRIRAVATVSAADIGRQFRVGADGTQDPRVIDGMLAAAANARTVEASGAPARTFEIFPATEEQARAGGEHVFEGWEYYRTDRAGHPGSAKQFTLSSIDRIVTFDPFAFMPAQPLLMVVGTRAATAWMTQLAYERARGPKRLHWVEGATHVSLYDRDVPAAATELTTFFTSTLADRAHSTA
ncbi:alpha/beta hydrolase [Asanoa sp. NPDC050611]|uniref:alpha/beta hydrolase n=1 Tax=Asanoa sp. NPDC050611 TaxID=3157098 RepID=UPI0033DCBF1E